jgi:glycosyltransferase involved in cell wall biosynthesis
MTGTKRALICAPLMPEFDRESGSRRVFDLIVFLREAGWSVSFAAQSGRDGERYVRVLQQLGVATYATLGAQTDELISSGRLDLALFAFYHLAAPLIPKVRKASPRTRVIVDTIDLHFLRRARGLFGAAGGPGNNSAPAPGGLDSAYGSQVVSELNVYAASDGVLTVSRKEADLLNDICGDPSLAHVVPDCEELGASQVPLDQRKGVAFVANFRHPPNVEAAEFLCADILPRVDPGLLARHPVSVVGNGLDGKVRAFADGLPHVSMVGWVPSVVPYVERARATVIPLRHGAGTKRKLVQALMAGTPTVSTSIGTEGMDLRSGEHVLVADDPQSFADGITRLLEDEVTWHRLKSRGREHAVARHGRAVARDGLLRAVELVLGRPLKSGGGSGSPAGGEDGDGHDAYARLRRRVRAAVCDAVPAGETVIVVSKGDDELLKLKGRRGWHFPQGEGGVYAGHHPPDSTAAVREVESLRAQGGRYLVFPQTSLWWLEHYGGLRRHLEIRYRQLFRDDDTCVIFELRAAAGRSRGA